MSCTSPAAPSADPLMRARAALARYFGYPDFRAPQLPAVTAVLRGGDVLIVLPTGGGKSLCYQVPALVRTGLTVVVSPLISLMADQVEALRRRGIGAAYLNSTLTGRETADRLAQARDGALTLLYLAPEKLVATRMLEALGRIGVSLLAVDEAHCISEWGHDFRPAYRRIGAMRARLGDPQTVALTATATPRVRRDIATQLALRDPTVIIGGFDRTNLTYHVAETPSLRDKHAQAVTWLRDAPGAAVVYASTRTAVEQVTAVLVRARVRAVAYHGGLPASVRQRAQDAFMDSRARVIVATSAFGMGIDKPDVRLVVHHAMPGSLEAYYQEAGRAGRDGQPSRCVLLHTATDRATHDHFLQRAHPDRRVVERTWAQLRACADRSGWVPRAPDAFIAALPAADQRAPVGAALRVLVAAGACRIAPPGADTHWIRLLATPARIRRELTGARRADRTALRALWQLAGDRLQDGVTIRATALPTGIGGDGGLISLLERLAAQQFLLWMRTGGGIRLTEEYRSMVSPPVDWRALDRRRHAEQQRLRAMVQYAQIRDCRRAYVLRYFGDASVRGPCGACDRCLPP
ncbi:MAG: RecQ family ATP-dependent DNA helicase [Gemmatimonadaceae bacterium]|nr:RecQ family ATP-dependent DNA helicase [Gemmatimonadaceae bacterium]